MDPNDFLPKVTRRDAIDILNRAERVRAYTKHKAGLLFGVMTVDAGRVRGKEYYRVLSWGNTNAAFWFFRDRYENYLNLPTSDDVEWVEESNYHARKMEIYREGRKRDSATGAQ